MNNNYRLLLIVALVQVSACSTIKGWFPDKEKDYQFNTEIPPLVLPADLAIDVLPTVASAPVQVTKPSFPTPDVQPQQMSATEATPAVDRKSIRVEQIVTESSEKRLLVTAPAEMAWRMVGKALRRNAIELVSSDQEQGIYRIQYDAKKQKVEDGSLWDELVFAVKGFDVAEQEFVIRLVENNQQTEVMVLDKEQKTVNDKSSNDLLNLLFDTLKAEQ